MARLTVAVVVALSVAVASFMLVACAPEDIDDPNGLDNPTASSWTETPIPDETAPPVVVTEPVAITKDNVVENSGLTPERYEETVQETHDKSRAYAGITSPAYMDPDELDKLMADIEAESGKPAVFIGKSDVPWEKNGTWGIGGALKENSSQNEDTKWDDTISGVLQEIQRRAESEGGNASDYTIIIVK